MNKLTRRSPSSFSEAANPSILIFDPHVAVGAEGDPPIEHHCEYTGKKLANMARRSHLSLFLLADSLVSFYSINFANPVTKDNLNVCWIKVPEESELGQALVSLANICKRDQLGRFKFFHTSLSKKIYCHLPLFITHRLKGSGQIVGLRGPFATSALVFHPCVYVRVGTNQRTRA